MTGNAADNRLANVQKNKQIEAQKVVRGVETPFGENVVIQLIVPSDVADKRYVSVGGGGIGGWQV